MNVHAAYPVRIRTAPAFPVAKLVTGKPVEEAAELLPRLFNLCRVAQSTAARAAFGLSLPEDWQDALRKEILREHVIKLCLKWPALLSIPSVPLPRDWMAGHVDVRTALFGPSARMPVTYSGFRDFIETSAGIAPVLCAISQIFARAEACRPALPKATPDTVFDPVAQENSVAGRQAGRQVLRDLEADLGRGPLWSALAVAYDLEDCLDGRLASASLVAGRAVVPAARGFYGVVAQVEQGHVAAFTRITPTDHLLATDGALQHTLATLPKRRAEARVQLLLSIMDPCVPVTVEPASTCEPAHA